MNEITETEVFPDSNLNFTVRVFIWGLENDYNICKKCSARFDTINWNNAISNLWEQSSEKVLHLTEQHVVPQF